ncbi:unnamed protein product [Umbelopsis vinacea]
MPPEFCEFSGTQEKCKTWLQKHHRDVYNQIYDTEGERLRGIIHEWFGRACRTNHIKNTAVEKGVEGIKLEEAPEEKKNDRSHVKDKSAQLEAKLEKENKKKMESHVIIKRVERTKRKCVTTIHGLEVFDVELKKAAKMFANRFACGSSVAKNNQNQDEIVVQGDFSDELLDLILANWPHIPEDNIDLVEDKKKK